MTGKQKALVLTIKAIVKSYFIGALSISFMHVIEAWHKLGLTGWQLWTTPAGIDGIAIIGMMMRSDAFSTSTRQLGLKLQLGAGALSLVCNVYAGDTVGERVYGILIVVLFILAEWVSSRIESRQVEHAREQAAKRMAAAAKATATRRANTAARERLVKNGKRRMSKELGEILATA